MRDRADREAIERSGQGEPGARGVDDERVDRDAIGRACRQGEPLELRVGLVEREGPSRRGSHVVSARARREPSCRPAVPGSHGDARRAEVGRPGAHAAPAGRADVEAPAGSHTDRAHAHVEASPVDARRAWTLARRLATPRRAPRRGRSRRGARPSCPPEGARGRGVRRGPSRRGGRARRGGPRGDRPCPSAAAVGRQGRARRRTRRRRGRAALASTVAERRPCATAALGVDASGEPVAARRWPSRDGMLASSLLPSASTPWSRPRDELRHLDLAVRGDRQVEPHRGHVGDGEAPLGVHRQTVEDVATRRDARVEARQGDRGVNRERGRHGQRVPQDGPLAGVDGDGPDLHLADRLEVEAPGDARVPLEAARRRPTPRARAPPRRRRGAR